MKKQVLSFVLLMAIFILGFLGARAQTPTYFCELRNDSLTSANSYEFDIYLLRTGTNVFEYSSGQYGIVLNSAIKAGTVTAKLVAANGLAYANYNAAILAGTTLLTDLPANNQPNTITFATATNVIKISGKTPAAGCFISNTGTGTRVARIRLETTTSFLQAQPNPAWSFTVNPYNTTISAYIAGINNVVIASGTFTTANLFNPLLNGSLTAYNVTGGGSYCQGGTGLPVGTDGSQVPGVKYLLYKGATPQGTWVPGTNFALTFGNQLAETYTVKAHRTATYMYADMTGSAILTESTPVTPTFAALGPYCVGATPGTLSLTSTNGITGTWDPATISTAVAGPTDYTFTPDAGQCATTAIMSVVVNAVVTPAFDALGPYCVGATPGTLSLTSTNGITGTWDPATITTATSGSTDYTFTPDAGQCATTAIMSVVVNAVVTPAFDALGPYCVGATPGTLSLTSTNGITGTWSPASISTATSGSTDYTFTPGYGQCATTAIMSVVVDPLPGAAGTITGPSPVIQGQTGVIFSVSAITNATGYNWSLPTGASITAGANTNSITVSFSGTAVSGIITVTGTNPCGSGTVSADFSLTVNPSVPVILNVDGTIFTNECYNATQTIIVANSGSFIVKPGAGATMIAGQNIVYKPGTTVELNGYMHGYISLTDHCGAKSATIVTAVAGEDPLPMISQKSSFRIYPNPTAGNFTLEHTGGSQNGTIKVAIYGTHGEKVMTRELTSEKKYEFSIFEFPAGLYFVKVVAGEEAETLKLIKTN